MFEYCGCVLFLAFIKLIGGFDTANVGIKDGQASTEYSNCFLTNKLYYF